MQPTALDAATLEKLISAAVAAPSIHNTQPWRYRLDPDTTTLEVQAVVERNLPYADPMGRALHLSVGAALFNLRVAVAHFGWEPVVRLLPHPADPCILAAVRLVGVIIARADLDAGRLQIAFVDARCLHGGDHGGHGVIVGIERLACRLGFAHDAERQKGEVRRRGGFAFARNDDTGRRLVGGTCHRRESDGSG